MLKMTTAITNACTRKTICTRGPHQTKFEYISGILYGLSSIMSALEELDLPWQRTYRLVSDHTPLIHTIDRSFLLLSCKSYTPIAHVVHLSFSLKRPMSCPLSILTSAAAAPRWWRSVVDPEESLSTCPPKRHAPG